MYPKWHTFLLDMFDLSVHILSGVFYVKLSILLLRVLDQMLELWISFKGNDFFFVALLF